MGTYKFYKLDFEGWADRITANKNQGMYLSSTQNSFALMANV